MTHISPNVIQNGFRARNDDGSESGATWKEPLNTNWNQSPDEVFRVRLAIEEFAGGSGNYGAHVLEYSTNGGTEWFLVTASTPIQFATSAFVADGTATTQQIATGTYLGGEFDSNGTIDTTYSYAGNDNVEMEFCLLIDSGQAPDSTVFNLRVQEVDSVSVMPALTVQSALAPAAPILGPPADDASIDFNVPQTFEWTFSSPEPGDSQTEYVFKRTAVDGVVSGTPTFGNATGIAYSHDGAWLAVQDGDSGDLLILDTTDWSTEQTITGGGGFGYLEFSPDNSLLISTNTVSPYFRVYSTVDWSLVAGTPTLPNDGGEISFSPDGSQVAVAHLATAGDLTSAKVYNTTTWAQDATLGTDGGSGVSWSPNGTWVAVGQNTSPYILVYLTATWTLVGTGPSAAAQADSVDFSPNSAWLAVDVNTGKVYDTSDWSLKTDLDVFGTDHVHFSPDGTKLLAARTTDTLIFETTVWTQISSVGSPNDVRGAKFSPTSDQVALGHISSPGLTVSGIEIPEYWNGVTWQSAEWFIVSATESVTFPTGQWNTDLVYRWTVKTKGDFGKVGPFATEFTIQHLAGGSDDLLANGVTTPAPVLGTPVLAGAVLAPTLTSPADLAEIPDNVPQTFQWTFNSSEPGDTQGEFAFKRRSTESMYLLTGLPPQDEPNGGVAFSIDGRYMAVGSEATAERYVEIVDMHTLTTVVRRPIVSLPKKLEFSPDGTFLAIGGTSNTHYTIRTSDWALQTWSANQTSGWDVSVSPDSSLIAIAGTAVVETVNFDLTVHNSSNGAIVHQELLNGPGRGCDFNNAGTRLAVVHQVQAPHLVIKDTSNWSTVSGTPVLGGTAVAVAYSHDDAWLAVAYWDQDGTGDDVVEIFNTSNWSVVQRIILPDSSAAIVFSPDDSLLSISGKLYNTSDWSEVPNMPGGFGGDSVAFSPDGSLHASRFDVLAVDPQDEWWNGAGWQFGEIYIVSTLEEVTFPADSW